MSYLADTNVLLRLAQRSHPLHPAALTAILTLDKRGEKLYALAQNYIEFWAVATRPIASNGLGLSTSQAAHELSGLKDFFALLPDTPTIFPEWERLVVAHHVSGKPTHDARLVAAMRVHGMARILTFNADDFKRFAGVTAIDPRAVAAGGDDEAR